MNNLKNNKKTSQITLIIFLVLIFISMLNVTVGNILLVLFIIIISFKSKKNGPKYAKSIIAQNTLDNSDNNNTNGAEVNDNTNQNNPENDISDNINPLVNLVIPEVNIRLEKHKKYLHIALNSNLKEAADIISKLPPSDRILIEAGTPLIKIYGTRAVSRIKRLAPIGSYIVADIKCADLASREVEMMAKAGANAATCLGVAPIETINSFIEQCQKYNIDSMIDMMNVDNALSVLKKLKKLPNVVMLHRGVDESDKSKDKQIPLYQIKQIKGNYNILVAVAGGDTINEVQQAIFNDADIVVVWKNFYESSSDTAELAESFLKEIKA